MKRTGPLLPCLLLGSWLVAGVADAAEGPAVQAFGLGDVELLEGPFKQAMQRNAEYLLSLEADRLLHNVRKYAGLTPKGELYGGWESQASPATRWDTT